MSNIPDPPPCGGAPECDTCRRWAEVLAKIDDAEADIRLLSTLHPDKTIRTILWGMSSDLTCVAIKLASIPWRHA